MRLQLLLMQLLLCVLPGMEMGASCRLTAWVVEDSSGKVEITCIGDTMDIVSPDGLSLWYKERLTGNYEITYRVQVVVENGSYDRLSDLNCFWGADDPRHPDDFFARSAWRNGEFKNYNTLDLYYVGYGGNDNGTTRFREYHGEYYGVDDAKIKPILKEYTDAAHLLKPNHWYEVKIRVENGATTYAMDGEELFSLPVADGKGDGYFALRLWQNHVRFADFQVANIDNLKSTDMMQFSKWKIGAVALVCMLLPGSVHAQIVKNERLLSFEEKQKASKTRIN